MLLIAEHLVQIDMKMLAAVYEGSNRENALSCINGQFSNLRYLESQNDFYDYLSYFLRDQNSFIAIWADNDQYCSAVRVEPYLDGVLFSGLETAPSERRKGYAMRLVQELIGYLKSRDVHRIYSHIKRDNANSISVHKHFGFNKSLDYAKCIDGSVSRNMDTYSITL